jgi:hypothetical protein
MGSRRGRNAALAGVLLAGCSVGAPPGFSKGDRWVVPLVGPLEDSTLVVPGFVGGTAGVKGPFLFAIDPDANISSVDEDVIKAAGLRTGVGDHMLDETDTEQPTIYAEVLQWQLGTLSTSGSHPAVAVKSGSLDREGRRINGVIGRDLIADSLAFSFDRDLGVITLETEKVFTPPPGATAVHYETVVSKVQNVDVVPSPRRAVTATIKDKSLAMHVQLGRVSSELKLRSWPAVGMPPEKPVADVRVAGLEAQQVPFVAYRDSRWEDHDVEGALGLSFFKHYAVAASWDRSTFYVRPRAEQPVATRIGRWQSKTLSSCEHAGCATVSMIDPLAGKIVDGPHPGLVVSVARDASSLQTPLEVVIAVTGKPGLPWLVASLPAGVDRAMTHVPADYIGATAAVVDASPFPRVCPAEGTGCIDKLAAP